MPRPFRVPDGTYRRALERARTDGVTLTSVVCAALERFAAHGSLEPVPEEPPHS
jgi:hypothetical protein